MTGSSTSFHKQPVKIRQQVLQSWALSYLPPLWQSLKAFNGLLLPMWARTSPTLGQVLGFPRAPTHGSPGKGYAYEFMRFSPDEEPVILETDVVIVGSGCGGAVCAKNLAEAGLNVIVCEKSYHWEPGHLPMTPQDSSVHLFMNGGMIPSDDSSVAVIAGQAFGGGGTINWSASLQTQAYVREEWANEGLTFFTSSEYQKSLDRICDRMGVSTKHIHHNQHNSILAEGARKLGYTHYDVPQNTGGRQHYCGYCTMGCGSADKQGPTVSFLPDAAKAGARFIEGFTCDRVLFDASNGNKIATGVAGTWTSRDSSNGVSGSDRYSRPITVTAKRVIISSGTVQSPLLLRRSGLTNPQIGRNLHIHPVTFVCAYYPDRPRMNPWEGGILTHVVSEFENQDGSGHGCKIECMTMLPSWVLPFQNWSGGLEYKELCTKMPWMTCHIPIVRDRDSGRIYPDPVDGQARIAYTPSAFDKKHCLEGLIAGAKIAYVEGAKEIWVTHAGVPPFVRSDTPAEPGNDEGINNKDFEAWLQRLRKRGLPSSEIAFGSAHQMGTCRMATSERAGVVDPKGKAWGTEGLYIADASVFPSASGVNPMLTNMGISDYISRRMAKDMGKRAPVEERARS